MSEISSGLVAVAWMAEDEDGDLEFNTINEFSCGRTEGTPLVRLSDAEAIIAQKDAEIIEQCRINGMGAEREVALLSKVERQSERIKELEADADEEAHIRDRMAQLLAETAVSLKGPEKALHRHGWQDLPEVAEKQSAALKLAMEALEKLSLYVAHNGDDWVKRTQCNRSPRRNRRRSNRRRHAGG